MSQSFVVHAGVCWCSRFWCMWRTESYAGKRVFWHQFLRHIERHCCHVLLCFLAYKSAWYMPALILKGVGTAHVYVSYIPYKIVTATVSEMKLMQHYCRTIATSWDVAALPRLYCAITKAASWVHKVCSTLRLFCFSESFWDVSKGSGRLWEHCQFKREQAHLNRQIVISSHLRWSNFPTYCNRMTAVNYLLYGLIFHSSLRVQ